MCVILFEAFTLGKIDEELSICNKKIIQIKSGINLNQFYSMKMFRMNLKRFYFMKMFKTHNIHAAETNKIHFD